MLPHANFIMECMAHGLNRKLRTLDHFLFGENARLLNQIDPLPCMTILFRRKRTKNERLTAGIDIR